MHWGKREEEKKKSKWSEKKLYQDTISDGNKKISVLNVYIYCQWTKTISIMFWKPCQSYTKTCMLQLNCTWKKQIWYDCKEPSSHHLNLPGTSPLITQAGPTLPWREYAQSKFGSAALCTEWKNGTPAEGGGSTVSEFLLLEKAVKP